MWHQLVLHGIGGRTIAEAKRSISDREFRRWLKYIEKNGTLDWGMRLEGGFALLAFLIANKVSNVVPTGRGQLQPVGVIKKQNGQKFAIRDFMPHAEPEEPQDFTIAQFLAVLGKPREPGTKKKRKRKPPQE